jgi:hypothetical protein
MKLHVLFNPNDNTAKDIIIEVERLFLGVYACLENRDEGFKLMIQETPICSLCGGKIIPYAVSSSGGLYANAKLKCKCSLWEGEASPFSGSFYATEKLKRTRKLTQEEIIQTALKEAGLNE